MRTDLVKHRTPRETITIGATLCVVFVSLLVACSNRIDASPPATNGLSGSSPAPTGETRAASATGSPSPAIPTPRPDFTPTPPSLQIDNLAPPLTRTRYTLATRFDYARHRLSVSQAVAFVNPTQRALSELVFVVEPNRQPGVFDLTGLDWADDQPVTDYALMGPLLRVPLPTALSPGKAITLALSFELNLPARSAPLGYTSRQTNLGDWHPFIPPYDAERGWLIREPGVVGEHQVYDVADYWVEITLVGPETDAVVAASGLVQRSDERTSQYRLEAARSFAWSASHVYHVISETTGTARATAYVFPEHRQAGEAALRAVADALALYAERFAPYPHTELAMVEAEFSDGIEYDGLFFLGQEYFSDYGGDPRGYLTAIAVHEAAHQWWYGLVGNDQANQPWLDETLATFSELLFYEAVHPDLTDWWWEFRVTRFEPQGWVDSTIYDHKGFRPYVDAVYLRGALFMQALRDLVGDEILFTFLRDYAKQGSRKQMATADFFALLDAHTEVELNPLIAQYFERAPLPSADLGQVVACPRPIDDYERVEINGEIISRRTAHMLDAAVSLYDGPGDLKRITQGSYTDQEASSFGTHDGGGAVDLSIRDPNDPGRILRDDEAHDMVLALRRAGFAAWFRDLDDLYPGSPMHIHAIAVGDRELSPAAQEQLTGPHGYFRGMDGLPHPDGPHPDPHGGPVLCDWMLELGYLDDVR